MPGRTFSTLSFIFDLSDIFLKSNNNSNYRPSALSKTLPQHRISLKRKRQKMRKRSFQRILKLAER